jgi:hypothetical protein
MIVRRIRFSPRKTPEPTTLPPPREPIWQREGDGRWFIGIGEDPIGPFETMQFATAVAAQQGGAA